LPGDSDKAWLEGYRLELVFNRTVRLLWTENARAAQILRFD
jgi:hypothetical protein